MSINMLSKNCLVCGKEFIKGENISVSSWFGNARRPNGVRFCSHLCHNKYLIGKKSKSNTKFKKGHHTWNKGLKGYRAGELNNKWKGGITSANEIFRKSKIYIIWRRIILMKDKFTCQDCGKVGGKLHAHHLKSFSKFPEYRLLIENGITLCIPCHKKRHPNLNLN